MTVYFRLVTAIDNQSGTCLIPPCGLQDVQGDPMTGGDAEGHGVLGSLAEGFKGAAESLREMVTGTESPLGACGGGGRAGGFGLWTISANMVTNVVLCVGCRK